MDTNEKTTEEVNQGYGLNSKWLNDIVEFFNTVYQLEDRKVFVITAMITKLNQMYGAMSEYCDTVEFDGTPNRTYIKFCEILERENKFEEEIALSIPSRNTLPL